jgi:tRNA (adenine57-N1/adenine58-N1)-methyltransferase
VLTRTHELVPPAPANTPARLRDITSIVTGLKEHEDKKNQRRIIQMKAAREKAREKKEAAASKAATAVPEPALDSEPSATGETSKDPEAKGDLTSPSALKRKHEELEVEAEITGPSAEGDPSKKPKTEGDDAVEGDIDQGAEDRVDKSTARIWTEPTTNIQNVIITKPSYEMRGHTSYLTFALYYPASIRQQLDSQDVAPTPGGSTPVPKRLEEVAVESREDRSGSQETEYGDKAMEEVMGTMTEEDMMALGA